MNEKRKQAAELLSQYKIIIEKKRIIEEQMYDMSSMLREATRTRVSDDKVTESKNNGYLDLLENNFVSLNASRGALKIRQKMIEGILDSLPPIERQIIRRYYIDGDYRRANDDLIEITGFEKSHIYRLRDRALDRIASLIDDFEQSYLPGKSWQNT